MSAQSTPRTVPVFIPQRDTFIAQLEALYPELVLSQSGGYIKYDNYAIRARLCHPSTDLRAPERQALMTLACHLLKEIPGSEGLREELYAVWGGRRGTVLGQGNGGRA